MSREERTTEPLINKDGPFPAPVPQKKPVPPPLVIPPPPPSSPWAAHVGELPKKEKRDDEPPSSQVPIVPYSPPSNAGLWIGGAVVVASVIALLVVIGNSLKRLPKEPKGEVPPIVLVAPTVVDEPEPAPSASAVAKQKVPPKSGSKVAGPPPPAKSGHEPPAPPPPAPPPAEVKASEAPPPAPSSSASRKRIFGNDDE